MTTTNYGFRANITVGAFTVFSANGDVASGNVLPSGNLVLSNTGYLVTTPGSNSNLTIRADGSGNVVLASNAYVANITATNTFSNSVTANTVTATSANVGALTITNLTWANGVSFNTGINYTASYAPPTTGNKPGDQWYSTLTDTVYEWTFNGSSYYWIDITTPALGFNPNLALTTGIVSSTANIQTLTIVNGIYWANGASWSSGGTTSGNVTSGGNLSVANLSVGSSNAITNTEAYDLDDISNYTDGRTNTFQPTYNTQAVSLPSPWSLDVYVNGIKQPAFKYNGDVFWLGYTLTANKGYSLDYSGNVRFADALPIRSTVTMTTKVGTNSQNTKRYPFNALDIILGM
jgi:hypothetical protein